MQDAAAQNKRAADAAEIACVKRNASQNLVNEVSRRRETRCGWISAPESG
jgi:hypothetical protein